MTGIDYPVKVSQTTVNIHLIGGAIVCVGIQPNGQLVVYEADNGNDGAPRFVTAGMLTVSQPESI